MMRFLSPALLVAAMTAPVAAHDFAVGSLKIGHPWTRETAPGQVVGGGFLSVSNNGRSADTLVGATTPNAKEVQLHTMSMEGGVMKMRPVTGGITIPAGQTVTLRSGGLHIMFLGLKSPFKRGQLIPVTLRFQKTGPVKVLFKVEPVGTVTPMEGNPHAGH